MTRFALLLLLPLSLLPACSDEPDTFDPSTTSGASSSSSSDASTGDGTTREGSSTSGESGSSGSSESGDLTTSSGTSSTGEHVDATDSSTTEIAVTSGDETTTGEGMTSGGDEVCWASHCDAETPCPAPLKCELHPDAVGLFVCTASCDECATGLLLCDSQVPQGECKEGNDMGKRCFPILCAVPEDCDFGEDCVDGFCT